MPRLSVVMPVFNAGDYLIEAVESILRQSFSDFELILINDGSTDGSGSILDRMARADARIRLHHQSNRGLVETLNRGFDLARTPYVARMDADDVAIPDRFDKQISYLEMHPEVALLGGAIDMINGQGEVFSHAAHACTNEEIQATLLKSCCFAHSTVMVRKDAVSAAGGYRKAFVHCEDYDLWLRLAEKHVLANLPDTVLQYRIHPQQVTSLHLRQQIVGAFAAQAAAQIRRQTGTDPVDNIEQLTPKLLQTMGVSEAAVAEGTANAFLSWAEFTLKTGNETSLCKVLLEATEFLRNKTVPKKTAANIYLALSGSFYRQREWRQSLIWLLRASSKGPSILRKLHRTENRRWFANPAKSTITSAESGSRQKTGIS